jgi:hypothetical protein
MMKKVSVGVLIGTVLILILNSSAFAAGVTLVLSRESGYKGDRIAISGTYDPNEWVTVKVLDADGNIVFIKPALAAGDGTYDTIFTVPNVSAGTLRITVGSGSDVTGADFKVKKKAGDKSSPAPKASTSPTPSASPSSTPGETSQPSSSATPSPAPSETPGAASSPTPGPSGSDDTIATPSPAPTTIPAKVVERDDKTGTVTVEIDVSALPEETKAIQMPNGAVIEIDGSDTIEITVSQDDLDESGSIELVLLDAEGLSLASVELQTADETVSDINGGQGGGGRRVFVWLLIGLVGTSVIGGTVYLILRRKRSI